MHRKPGLLSTIIYLYFIFIFYLLYSDSLQLALAENDDNKLINLYLHLYEDDLDKEHSILGNLKNFKGANILKSYVTLLSSYWFQIISERFIQ